MKILAALVLVISLMSVCCSGGRVKNPSALIRHTGAATVALVWTNEEGNVRSYCTGTWISDNEILTAHHCAQKIANINAESEVDVGVIGARAHYIVEDEVEGVGEEPSGVHLGVVVADDKAHELAIIRAIGKRIPRHDVAKIGKMSPAIGEKIYVVGQVIGLYWTHVEGVVSAYRDGIPSDLKITGPFIQVSAPIYYGNSGGAIFNQDGEIVGVLSFILPAPLVGFGIYLDSVQKFVRDAHK